MGCVNMHMKIQDIEFVNYFAYGHNTLEQTMQVRAPSAEPVGVGILHNFQLTFHKYANIENQDNAETWGMVWRISKEDLHMLDEDEGLHVHYTRIPVEIHLLDGRVVRATTYIMEPTYSPHIGPDADYVRDVKQGYQQHHIPLRQLTQALDSKDLDRAR